MLLLHGVPERTGFAENKGDFSFPLPHGSCGRTGKSAVDDTETLLVLGDEEQGIAVVKADVMKEVAVKILKGLGHFKGDYDEK